MREESNQVALWVLRAQCGDREALELLLRHIQPSLRRYLAGLVGASDADDALQELLATNQISPGCSAVLTLHFEEQMTLTEVAEALEIPLGTVKSRLAYGLAALRKRLGDRRNY